MDFQRGEWVHYWDGSYVYVIISDDRPALQISDSMVTVGLCHYHSSNSTTAMDRQENRYFELNPDSVSHG